MNNNVMKSDTFLRWLILLIILASLYACNSITPQPILETSSPLQTPLRATFTSSTFLPATSTISIRSEPSATSTIFPSSYILTNTPEKTSSPSQNLANIHLKIAYLRTEPSSNIQPETTNLWVLESPYRESRKVFSFEPQVGHFSEIKWSNDGEKIAFIKIVRGQHLLSILNLNTLRVKDIQIDSNGYYVYTQWSLDDQYIGLYSMVSGTQYPSRIINIATGYTIALPTGAEFVAWSKAYPKQYLYLQHKYKPIPNSILFEKLSTLNVSEIGQQNAVSTVSGLGEFTPERSFHIAWSNDSSFAIVTAHDSNIYSHITRVDFKNNRWEKLITKDGYGGPGFWSPDGQWLAYYFSDISVGSTIKLFKFKQYELENTQDTWITGDSAIQQGWTRDSKYLVIQIGYTLYAVDPNNPTVIRQLLDLSHLGLPSKPIGTIFEVWIAGK